MVARSRIAESSSSRVRYWLKRFRCWGTLGYIFVSLFGVKSNSNCAASVPQNLAAEHETSAQEEKERTVGDCSL